jgi:hypothetical protein
LGTIQKESTMLIGIYFLLSDEIQGIKIDLVVVSFLSLKRCGVSTSLLYVISLLFSLLLFIFSSISFISCIWKISSLIFNHLNHKQYFSIHFIDSSDQTNFLIYLFNSGYLLVNKFFLSDVKNNSVHHQGKFQ